VSATTAVVAPTDEKEVAEQTGAFSDFGLWFSTTTAHPAVMVAMPTPSVWNDPTALGARYYLKWETAVVPQSIRPTSPPAGAPYVEEIEVAPQLGMNFGEAVRRGRLLAQRLGDAADGDVGD